MKVWWLLSLFLLGCASSEEERYPAYVHPAAYGADGFPIHAPPPERDHEPDARFYFKECSPTGGRTYYSHTSYVCDGF
tara:strand:- start:18312 stop:18545 length:234 start_codon:yes stop_codon:yes gene_type:complete